MTAMATARHDSQHRLERHRRTTPRHRRPIPASEEEARRKCRRPNRYVQKRAGAVLPEFLPVLPDLERRLSP